MALCLASAAPFAVQAQPSGTEGGPPTPVAVCAKGLLGDALDLQQALTRALCHDPRTQQSWAQWQARAAQLELERAQAWPIVTASADLGSARQRQREVAETTFNKGGVGQAALELSWVLMDFGQQRAGERVAQHSVLAAAAAHDDAVMEVTLSTARAFFALAEAQAVVQELGNEARFADELMSQHGQRNATAKVSNDKAALAATQPAKGRTSASSTRSSPRRGQADATVVPPSKTDAMDAEMERLRVRTERSRATLERRLSRGAWLQARGTLAQQLGVPLQNGLVVRVEDSGADATLTESALDPLLEEVLRDHPSLRAARARLGAADAELDLARRSAAPRLTLQHAQRAGRDVLRSNSREASMGLQLDVPLFAGFARKHRESMAQAQLDAARAELRSAEQQVALQTWAAYQSLQTHAVATRQAANFEADAKALAAAEMASYRAGNSDLTDLLDSHKTATEATLARISSLTAWRLARVQLAASLGRLHQALGATATRP